MGVVLLWRVAIALGASTRVARSFGDEAGQPSWHSMVEHFRDRLSDPGEDDAALADDMAAFSGYGWNIATFTGTFELRKLHVMWVQEDATVVSDDARVCTFHLLKLASGSPVDTWDAGDFTALTGAFNTWWGSIKDRFAAKTILDRYKVYKDGPAIVPPQTPVYELDVNTPGTSAQTQLPPQVSISVTEKAGSKRNWGRFYLPSPSFGSLDTFGRLDSGYAGDVADATDVLYTALRTANLSPVVYRRALPERENAAGATLAARAASAMEITDIQVDDVLDVIRSRRFKNVGLRTQRAI